MTKTPQISAQVLRRLQHALRRHRVADHHRPAGAHDAGFFAAYAFAVRAQILHVVQVNAGDNGTVCVNQVDGVQAPTQPHFQNSNVQSGIGHLLQKNQRGELKITQGDGASTVFGPGLLAGVFHLLEKGQQRSRADDLAAQATALLKMHQMRRRVNAGSVTGLQQNSL